MRPILCQHPFPKEFAEDTGKQIEFFFGLGVSGSEQRGQSHSQTALDGLFFFGTGNCLAQLAANLIENLDREAGGQLG